MAWLETIYHVVWGAPMLILLIGNGLFLTIALRGLQFRYLFYAFRLVFFPNQETEKKGRGDISNFESLMTALAGSLGIGNIAGVATALTLGGLGALFWMWVMALIGMATKYAEAILAVKYRQIDDKGEMCGGPMYFIEKGLGCRSLAWCFAACGVVAAFGGGNMIQANSVADVLEAHFSLNPLITGILLSLITGTILIGGIKGIAKIAAFLVPFMALFYITGGCLILFKYYDRIPEAVLSIVKLAFSGEAAVGGGIGASLMMVVRVGLSRGLMTSEAGLGTASIAAAAAKTDVPGRQAMVSMTGSFIATIILCSVTGLVIAVTDVLGTLKENGAILNGASLTMTAFHSAFFGGDYIVIVGLCLFALTTLLGWAYYGEKCLEFIFGTKASAFYRVLFTLAIIPGAVLELDIVWKIADITNGLMAYPNLIGLTCLSGVVIAETRTFLNVVQNERALPRSAVPKKM